MIRAFIVDDIEANRIALKKLLDLCELEVEVVGEASSVQEGVEKIDHSTFDLLFLDVELGSEKGFDIVRKVKNTDFKIIFITAHAHYAIEAIKLSAIDFLLKPIDPDELEEGIRKVQKELKGGDYLKILDTLKANLGTASKNEKKVVLRTQDSIKVVKVTDIIHCESDINYTVFHLNNGPKLVISKPLKEYEELLSDYGFFRSHKSHLINLDYLVSYEKKDGGYILLSNGDSIPVSNRKKEILLNFLENH